MPNDNRDTSPIRMGDETVPARSIAAQWREQFSQESYDFVPPVYGIFGAWANRDLVQASIVRKFISSLTEIQGYVPGEWPEYEALLEELGDNGE